MSEPISEPAAEPLPEPTSGPPPDSIPGPLSEPMTGLVARLRAAGCVFAEDEARLLHGTARTPAELAAMTERRVAGHPLEHVLGWAEFAGLRVEVGHGVFVPRRRTEFLVERAAAAVAAARATPAVPRRGPAVLLDLCCGSGAVGAAVLAALGGRGELYAADLDPAAVDCARRNLAAVGGLVYEGDLFAALPGELRGRVDLLTANVPYVPSGELALLPSEARDFEPGAALDGGPDGLALLRRVAAEAPDWLAPGGSLLTETSAHQSEAAARLLEAALLTVEISHSPAFPATTLTATRPG